MCMKESCAVWCLLALLDVQRGGRATGFEGHASSLPPSSPHPLPSPPLPTPGSPPHPPHPLTLLESRPSRVTRMAALKGRRGERGGGVMVSPSYNFSAVIVDIISLCNGHQSIQLLSHVQHGILGCMTCILGCCRTSHL